MPVSSARFSRSPAFRAFLIELPPPTPKEVGLLSLLSAADQERLSRIPSRDRARQFLWARCLIAWFLERVARAPARFGCLSVDASGRPFLAGADPGCYLDLNVSHSGSFVAAAFSSFGRVGVDVEMDSSFDARLPARFFYPSEVSWLAGQEAPARAAAFSRLWTVKEACFKSLGSGAVAPLEEVREPGASSGEWPEGRWWAVRVKDEASCAVALRSASEEAPYGTITWVQAEEIVAMVSARLPAC